MVSTYTSLGSILQRKWDYKTMNKFTDDQIEEIIFLIRMVADESYWNNYEEYGKYGAYNVQAWTSKYFDPQYMAAQLLEKLGINDE